MAFIAPALLPVGAGMFGLWYGTYDVTLKVTGTFIGTKRVRDHDAMPTRPFSTRPRKRISSMGRIAAPLASTPAWPTTTTTTTITNNRRRRYAVPRADHDPAREHVRYGPTR
mmetsp:Transcript_54663/g.150559  ORF Transcript_54663/g.150559 Transcript_54663/m.150559 type:complete len:112 (+) Transcript_54663:153-488(+)